MTLLPCYREAVRNFKLGCAIERYTTALSAYEQAPSQALLVKLTAAACALADLSCAAQAS